MKRCVVILALLLCLSACGGSVPAEREAASGSAQTAIQTGPSPGLRGAQLLDGGPLTDGLQRDAW